MESVIFSPFVPAHNRKEPPKYNIRPHHASYSHSSSLFPTIHTHASSHVPAHSPHCLSSLPAFILLCSPPHTHRSKRYHSPYLPCTLESNDATDIMAKRIYSLDLLSFFFVPNRQFTSPEDTLRPGVPKYVIAQRRPSQLCPIPIHSLREPTLVDGSGLDSRVATSRETLMVQCCADCGLSS